MVMAPKKKKADMDDVAKAKAKMGEGARAVGKAAERVLRIPMDAETRFGADWDKSANELDALDKEFAADEEENFVDVLKSKFRKGEVDVRVMQLGPDGRLTDVSDKVNPKDLKPEDIGGIQTDDGRALAIGRNPQSREAALRLLQELLPMPLGQYRTSESIRRMELVLAESDKILAHWKK
jgi:hypothetical protein